MKTFLRDQRRTLWSLGGAQAGGPEFRKRLVEQNLLANLEKAAQRYEAWSERRSPGHIAAMREPHAARTRCRRVRKDCVIGIDIAGVSDLVSIEVGGALRPCVVRVLAIPCPPETVI